MRNLKRITLYIMSIVDIFSLIAAFIVSYIIKFRLVEKNSEGLVSSSSYMTLLVCSILAYLLVNIIFLYNDNFIERSSAKELLATLKMVVYVTIMIILFMFFAKISNQYSRAHVAIFSILAFLIDAVSRIVIKKYVLQKYKNRNGSEKIVVIAPYSHIPEILKKLENPLNWNCKVVGVVASDYDKKGETVQGIPVISNSEYMYKDIANAEVDSVFVDTGSETHEYIRSCTQKMQEIGKKVHVRVEEYYINDSIRTIDRLGEYAVVSYFPNYPMKNMSVSQRQMCEIAKAISYNSKVIVLDEPTSSLTVQEVEKLFQMMRMLRDQGISLIYISHKMDEIFEICDEISVLRDGNLVMTKSTKETNMNELIAAMVGRVLENRFPPVDNKPKDVILSIQHLSTKYEPHLQDITFDVHEGEIFGLYGLVGAGRTELLETIFGIRTRAAGRVYFKNQLMNFTCAKEAMDYGFALITEERKANGLFLKGNLTFNTTIANLGAYKNGPALSDSKMTKATSDEIKIMHTKCMGPEDMISALSGGNQQKVIFGKWLERGPQIFMMDEPTRGIDVGAKYEIYELIINMAKQGKTVIVVSSEMPEILGITNRIGVMSNGRLSGIVNTKETNQEELLRLSAKYL